MGLFGIGLEASWPKLEGLKPRLEGYPSQVADKIAHPGVEICDLGLIDSPEKALEASHAMRRADVDTLHVACALVLGASQFLTFDAKQRLVARESGLEVPVEKATSCQESAKHS